MSLHPVRLTSLAEELDLILPPRDKQEMPIKVLPSREVIERQLNPPNVVPYRRRRK